MPDGPVLITGDFEYTNDFVVETYYVEHAVGLLDMTGFVLRDKEWEMPVESQVLGFMDLDEENDSATYRLSLPAVPYGSSMMWIRTMQAEQGLQIFAVGYNPNLTGGVFSEGDDRSLGWPGYLASVKTDSENKDEVIRRQADHLGGGRRSRNSRPISARMGCCSPRMIRSAAVPAGYSVVDLDTVPFAFNNDQVGGCGSVRAG